MTGALLTAIHDWHQALEIGIDVCAVFLDLSKAFDKVPYIPLLSKLAALNIPRPLLNSFSAKGYSESLSTGRAQFHHMSSQVFHKVQFWVLFFS